jgi:large subunit ribosomal protein L5
MMADEKEQKKPKAASGGEGKPAKSGGGEGKAAKSKGGGDRGAKSAAPATESGRPSASFKGGARLRNRFKTEMAPALAKELGLENPMAVPKVEKVIVNMGVGEATQNVKVLDPLVSDLATITGQKPVVTKAKKSIAAFKVREGMPIGAMVTLRGDRMYEFLDRLLNVALPRVRDFRGVSTKSFDGRGNYTMGIRDQLIFPEIDYSRVEKLKGMNITIVTSAKSDDQARALLKHMGMPFRQ